MDWQDSMQALTWERTHHLKTLGLLLLPAAILVAVTWTLIGRFFYTLDDAYIHLQLAEMIGQHGHFGLHLNSVASPSSSLLWTLWLTAWSWLPVGFDYIPLLTNLCILALLANDLHQWLHHRLSQRNNSIWLLTAILISLNVYWLTLSGMEQLTQAWLAARVMIAVSQQQWQTRSLYVAIYALALIRYESLALCLPVLMLAASNDASKKAFATLLILLLTLGAYSLYLHESLALGWLPASVQIKSVFAELDGRSLHDFWAAILENIHFVMQQEYNRYVLWLVIGWIAAGRNTLGRQLMAIATFVYVAHALFGRVNSGRYEVYVLASCWVATLHNTFSLLERYLTSNARRIIFLMLVIVLNTGSFYSGLSAPWAAKNIHDQQGQLAVLVQHYLKQSVAVNDVGLISRHNALPVLDLVGLGTKGVYELRKALGPGSDWISILLLQHETHYAMVYEHWFPDWPHHLIKVATYEISGPLFTPAGRRVSLFADSPNSARILQQAITRYQADHPARSAWFTVFKPDAP
jgi:hypothetical protein